MLAQYQRAYTACVASGNGPTTCAVRVYRACSGDPFWAGTKPFSVDLQAVQTDAASKCAKLG
jgi:hypothetical protein